jgi:hypothetical protein
MDVKGKATVIENTVTVSSDTADPDGSNNSGLDGPWVAIPAPIHGWMS